MPDLKSSHCVPSPGSAGCRHARSGGDPRASHRCSLRGRGVLWRQDHLDEIWLLLHIFFGEDLAPDGLDVSEGVHQAVDFTEALRRVVEVLHVFVFLYRALVGLGAVVLC